MVLRRLTRAFPRDENINVPELPHHRQPVVQPRRETKVPIINVESPARTNPEEEDEA